METSDDTLYFTCLEDRQQTYLLQSNAEDLCEGETNLSMEPIFTEIENGTSAWSVENLPIFFSSSYIPENTGNSKNMTSLMKLAPTKKSHSDQVEDFTELFLHLKVNANKHQYDQVSEEPSFTVNDARNTLQDLCSEDDNTERQIVDAIKPEESNSFYPVEVPEKNFVTTDLFTPNDLLLQLNFPCGEEPANNQLVDEANTEEPEQNIDSVKTILFNENLTVAEESNSNENQESNYNKENDISSELPNELNINDQKAFELNVERNTEVPQSCCNEIIQLFNTDGSVINIDKSLLSPNLFENHLLMESEDNSEEVKLEDLYELVTAYKCKECSFLSEQNEEMVKHLKEAHLQTNEKINKKALDKCKLGETENRTDLDNNTLQKIMNKEVKMVSILNNKTETSEAKRRTLYLCSQCNIGYAKKETLKTHMLTAHFTNVKSINKQEDSSPAEVKSNEEEKRIIQNNNMKLSASLIKKQQKASKKIKCSIKGCDLRFAREDTRKRHESCHIDGQKKQFACPECNERFSIWRICSMHLWKCHKIDMDLFTCPMCNNFKASTSVRLISHMAIHNDEKPFLCSTCGKTFKTISQLSNHQVIHKEVSPEWASQQQCDICKKFFANSKSLKKHIQCVHNKYKPFICNVCGHKTARKAMLELHLRQHTGEKPHKCPMCEYKTGDHNSLRRHLMRHSGDTKYSCPHCDYQSIQSAAYKNHIASKHPGQGGSYFCELCSYHTVNENIYSAHMIDHKNGLIFNNLSKNGKQQEKANTISEKNFTNEAKESDSAKEIEDDETQNCFLSLDNSDETVDTGGITIPESLDL